ncbi:excinuclease ABC subunit UvrC [Desulfosudis oleivorans]|uniref:UvrABC system protein C n=1 Tax=Desulfosudis oleivorans (strain DSM 6200 / JCM 39069 / Hxd3) TaxID=96561 RepID=A8ZVJ2_DESOH|nr:excinuclease ABC subunit UvrC [Desulfosudis oleivorans]ABW68179.1 excinuclease ABC, C subunit [Desulfosudis oleivorans Hxd3]
MKTQAKTDNEHELPEDRLAEKLAGAPARPGVYLMKDGAGAIIYVGKAFNLKKRLASYFVKKERLDLKTGLLMERVVDFDTIVTATENEALILEASLIRRHKPRYNVLLKDDKRYPSLRIDPRQPYPALEIVRKTRPDGAVYFGPFSSARAVRETLKVVDKTFRLRKCRGKVFKKRSRPCINFQMGLCLGPCFYDVPENDYAEAVREVSLFLKGRATELVSDLRVRMKGAAENQEFEKAALLRDRLFAIEKVIEKQVVVTPDFADRDVIAVAEEGRRSVVALLQVRKGVLSGTRFFHFEELLSSVADSLATFMVQYYTEPGRVPDEILTDGTPFGGPWIADHLRDLAEKRVNMAVPRRGEKFLLIKMARENAQNELAAAALGARKHQKTLERLARKLGLSDVPARIACVDNSHLAGTGTVAAVVVFADGVPDPSAYRRYRLAGVPAADDYAAMKQVLVRRFAAGADDAGPVDLLLVDGGRGQLNIAAAVLQEAGLAGKMGVAAISKKDEAKEETADKVYVPGRRNPVNLGPADPALFLLEEIRDEAHRFAIDYQRKERKRISLRSALDDIPGIGPQRKRMLLDRFGTVEGVRAASVEDLAALPGITGSMAGQIREHLRAQGFKGSRG